MAYNSDSAAKISRYMLQTCKIESLRLKTFLSQFDIFSLLLACVAGGISRASAFVLNLVAKP